MALREACKIHCNASVTYMHQHGCEGCEKRCPELGEIDRGANNSRINLMNQTILTQLQNLRSARRCGARNRAGQPCQCPAIRSRLRCRIHGGLSPGAPRREGNGNFKHGFWTSEAVQERRWVRNMLQLYAKGTDK
jgi:hypothetical protein